MRVPIAFKILCKQNWTEKYFCSVISITGLNRSNTRKEEEDEKICGR
jgi:hypothetical protein